jgi:hypothetical protein
MIENIISTLIISFILFVCSILGQYLMRERKGCNEYNMLRIQLDERPICYIRYLFKYKL